MDQPRITADEVEQDGMMVYLHIYDISQGFAKQFSQPLLGKSLEGIWHTGIVCYGKEFYFGAGITADNPKQTPFQTPTEVMELGRTHVPVKLFDDYLNQLRPRYTADTYHLLDNNCNNFTQDVAIFLTGQSIPPKIACLPTDAMDSPLGKLIRPLIENMERMLKGSTNPGASGGPRAGDPSEAPQSSVFLLNTSQPALYSLGNLSAIHLKLQSMNQRLAPDRRFTPQEEEDLRCLVEYLAQEADYDCEVPPASYTLLERIIQTWPLASLYPAVDILRLLVLWHEASMHYSTEPGVFLLLKLMTILQDGAQTACPSAFRLMVLRLVNNMFATEEGAQVVLSPHCAMLTLQLAIDHIISEDVCTAAVCATILFNASSKLQEIGHDAMARSVAALMHVIPLTTDEDCLFRMLMALGRILWNNQVAVELFRLCNFSVDHHLKAEAEHIKLVAHEIKAVVLK